MSWPAIPQQLRDRNSDPRVRVRFRLASPRSDSDRWTLEAAPRCTDQRLAGHTKADHLDFAVST